MSELLLGNVYTPTSGAISRTSTGAEPKPGMPAPVGNSDISSGKQLPVQEEKEAPEMQAVARTLTAVSLSIGHDLKFIVDLKDNPPIIQVLDRETGEVIRQIPAAELSTYARKNGAEGVRLLDTLV